MAEYVTDIDAALGIAEGDWKQLAPMAAETKARTGSIAADAVGQMQEASARAKNDIRTALTDATNRFEMCTKGLDGLNATGRSADNMRVASADLTAKVGQLNEALSQAFEELDREIVELGGEVQAVVDEFGAEFDKAGNVSEENRTAFVGYLEAQRDLYDNGLQYSG